MGIENYLIILNAEAEATTLLARENLMFVTGISGWVIFEVGFNRHTTLDLTELVIRESGVKRGFAIKIQDLIIKFWRLGH